MGQLHRRTPHYFLLGSKTRNLGTHHSSPGNNGTDRDRRRSDDTRLSHSTHSRCDGIDLCYRIRRRSRHGDLRSGRCADGAGAERGAVSGRIGGNVESFLIPLAGVRVPFNESSGGWVENGASVIVEGIGAVRCWYKMACANGLSEDRILDMYQEGIKRTLVYCRVGMTSLRLGSFRTQCSRSGRDPGDI
jgi:hypothetical protein